ncbi:protein-glutamate O-methyltransferase CheR [bacterium]|nr:protein-glutamate O-methyltransferase CheR [bacterium]
MKNSTFKILQKLIYDQSGICLGDSKLTLLQTRVGRLMRQRGIIDYQKYVDYLKNDSDGTRLNDLLDAISTNVTSFFREFEQFKLLDKIIYKWLDKGYKKIRAWSCACSTGEEPYSMAITFSEVIKSKNIDVKILATDINTQVLETARKREYTEERIEPVSRPLRIKYFKTSKKDEEKIYQVNMGLRKMITFKRINLSTNPFPMKGPFDVIFCRNVMIYFDKKMRTQLLMQIHHLLKPGGYIMLGHSESLTGLNIPLEYVQPSVYRKKEDE